MPSLPRYLTITDVISKIMTLWYAILFVLLPLVFLTSTSELFELNKMMLVYVLSILILTTWGAKLVITKKFYWKKTPFDIPLLLFLSGQILATFFSIHLHTSLFGYYSRWHGGLISTFAYIVIFYGAIQNFSKKQLKFFLSLILLGGVLSSIYAIPEHFGVSPSCTLIEIQDNLEEGKTLLFTISDIFKNPGKFFTTDCWSERTNPKYRIFGTFGQPNWLAAYVIMLIPLSVLLGLNEENQIKNLSSKLQVSNSKFQKFLSPFNLQLSTFPSITFFLLPLTLFSTLLFTTSRSGFLGFIVSLGILLFGILFTHRKQKDKKGGKFFNLFILYFISYILFSLLFGTPFTPPLKQLFATPSASPQQTQPYKDPGDLGGTDSGDIRKIVWSGAIKVWQRYPIFGSGVETFGYSYYQDRPLEHNYVSEWEYLYNKAHNEFLNYLATTGIVGLSMYLLWQVWVYFVLMKIFVDDKNSDFSRLFSIATLASLSALHVSNFFGFSTVTVSVLFYLLPGMVWLSTQKDLPEKQPHLPKSLVAWQQLTLLVITVGAIIPLVQVFALWQADYLYSRSQKELRWGNFTTAEKLIKQAIAFSPSEGVYYDQLGKVESEFAVSLANEEEYELGGQKATEALDASNQMLILNPYHLSFYRARVTILLTLASAQPALYEEALKTVVASQSLAPTDPKLPYTEGLIEQALEATPEAILAFQKAVDLKPDYEGARWQLGQMFELKGEIDKAIDQYQYMVDYIPTGNTPTVKERLEILEASQSAKASSK